MQGDLLQSSTNVRAREDELVALRNDLEIVKEKARHPAAGQKAENDKLRAEFDRARKETRDSLAEANVEITQRGRVLERKERALVERCRGGSMSPRRRRRGR